MKGHKVQLAALGAEALDFCFWVVLSQLSIFIYTFRQPAFFHSHALGPDHPFLPFLAGFACDATFGDGPGLQSGNGDLPAAFFANAVFPISHIQ